MLNEIITTEAARDGFYPTPPYVADKLLDGVDWDMISNVLEPSAGKGNIVDRIAEKWNRSRWKSRKRRSSIQQDHVQARLLSVRAYTGDACAYGPGLGKRWHRR